MEQQGEEEGGGGRMGGKGPDMAHTTCIRMYVQ